MNLSNCAVGKAWFVKDLENTFAFDFGKRSTARASPSDGCGSRQSPAVIGASRDTEGSTGLAQAHDRRRAFDDVGYFGAVSASKSFSKSDAIFF